MKKCEKKIVIIIAKFAIMQEMQIMQKTINAKNVRNYVIREILFIAINHNAINVINARIYRIYLHEKSQEFFTFIAFLAYK